MQTGLQPLLRQQLGVRLLTSQWVSLSVGLERSEPYVVVEEPQREGLDALLRGGQRAEPCGHGFS